MKKTTLSLLLLIIACLQAKAQNLVGIYNHTISISPSFTVNNNTSITVSGQVVNLGTTPFTGDIHVNIAIDSSSTSTPKYYWRSTMSYPVVNFPPNGILLFNVSDIASDNNGYKVAGNGTTVVAWPIAGSLSDSLTGNDSAFVNVYILPLAQSVNELELLEKQLQNLPNPLTQSIHFTNTENWAVELIDMNGKAIEILNDSSTKLSNHKLEISNYSKGLYLLHFKNKNGNSVSKKIIIQ